MARNILFILSIFITAFTGSLRAQSKQPNIILIISDDHTRQAISAYGSKIAQTPNIDRLAKEGAIFKSAYITNSICGPSRASILSGTYSHINGLKDNSSDNNNSAGNFDFNQKSFAKSLQEAGYETAWIGKMHLGDNTPQGFDYYNILPGHGQYYNSDFIEKGSKPKKHIGYVSNLITDLSVDWLDKRDKTKPFCLVIGHKAPHRQWMPDLQDLGKYDEVNFELPHNFYDAYDGRKAALQQDMTIANTMQLGYDLKVYQTADSLANDWSIKNLTKEQREKYLPYYEKIRQEFVSKNLKGKELIEWKYQRYMKDYLATAASVDRNIGETLDYLDKNNLTENTIVIYMSDQGFYLGEHGWFDKRFMYEESFSTPMLMRFPGTIKPGTEINDFIMNIDIAPTLVDVANGNIPDRFQGTSFLPLLKNEKYNSRNEMYYHYYEKGTHSVSPHFGIKTKKYKLIRFYDSVESWEFFDLEKDPNEVHNIYKEKASAPIINNLKKKLSGLIKKYKDDEAAVIFKRPV